jgi:hypothetical protein
MLIFTGEASIRDILIAILFISIIIPIIFIPIIFLGREVIIIIIIIRVRILGGTVRVMAVTTTGDSG